MSETTLEHWVRLNSKGQLKGAGDKPVSPEQMELARLRAELARVKLERDFLKKGHGVLRSGINVKYAWVAGNKTQRQRLLRALAAKGCGRTQQDRDEPTPQ